MPVAEAEIIESARPATAVVLLAAAEVLERDGWCQHQAHSTDGRHCAIGAMQVARAELGLSMAPDREVLSLRKVIGKDSVAVWNDTASRTKAEVVETLRRAARYSR